MQSYDISNKKELMAKLLKSDLFDTFEVREVILHTAFKMVLEGRRNKDYFDKEDTIIDSLYLEWREMRKNVYELLQGNKPPTYFKIILAASTEKTAVLSQDINACYLNIQFKENHITCSTGVSYKHFSLDQSADKLWDERIKAFLFQYHFIE
ncbi:DUF5721 family protein [Cellulosilyticum sp. I15G10I2]|uniref:DUF5721 family protein n=1 Tax=Cellulosilyticum sp. I15G10I2 TaxID=1892843 RepID=UPI00085BC296|nr:DUF5721 family protein [Cellulosilyticum sp. I15G10I2]